MNKKNAYKILDLDIDNPDINIDSIKRHYRLKALTYHPDKNKDPDASNKFHEIHDAYEYLLKTEGYMNSDDSKYNTDSHAVSYRNLFMTFLKKILESENSKLVVYNIIQRITTLCETKAFELLERLDKPTLITTRNIISKYKEAFHVTDIIIDKINTLIQNKNVTDEYVILNPTLTDLYENNLYKLTINGETYIIPLWHHELVYDNNGNDLYVNCLPDLPSHINIDENNNIHIDVQYNINDIWEQEYIQIKCDSMCYPIQVSTLKMTKTQVVVFAKQGVSKINAKNIYDVSSKSDTYITLHLTI